MVKPGRQSRSMICGPRLLSIQLPAAPAYLVDGLDRGDAMSNWSPAEADPAIAAADRTPLTLTEGLYWLLQRPESLERGRCFRTMP